MFGMHFKVYPKTLAVNIPYRPHCILVLCIGHLRSNGQFLRWVPNAYRMRLNSCCSRRIDQLVRQERDRERAS